MAANDTNQESDRVGRLIKMAVGRPAENMAIDQSLLESADQEGRPSLRLYQWSEPTLSIGYFQKLRERAQHVPSASLSCVRRSTGGGAIVHHHELTYSIAMPTNGGATAGPRLDLYERTHQAVVEMLAEFGIRVVPFRLLAASNEGSDKEPFLCFQRRTSEDLIISGYKVLGSAQRTSRRAILQHGSLLLKASPWAPELPGVADLTSRAIPADQLAESLAGVLARRLSIDWVEQPISEVERARAVRIEAERFAASRWQERR